jgi:hypothetical protein
MVDFVPGITTRPASDGIGSPGRHHHHRNARLGASAGRDRRSWRCGAASAPPRRTHRPGSPTGRTASASPCDPPPAGRRFRAATARPPSEGQPVRFRDQRESVGEEAGIAAELIDGEAADARPVGCVQHGVGSDEGRDDATAIDVADQHDGHVRCFGEAHVGDVAGAEVGLGRAAGALDEHDVGPLPQPPEALDARAAGVPPCGARTRRRASSRSVGPAPPPARRSRPRA